MSEAEYSRFEVWADTALDVTVPQDVVAFCFNITETLDAFVVDLVGSPEFDPEDQDWACNDTFAPAVSEFELPYAEVGRAWEPVLELVREFVVKYVEESQKGGSVLRGVDAVAVGFVDGELAVVRGPD